MSVKRYRKRPRPVEAMQFTGSNFYECARFAGNGDLTGNDMIHPEDYPVVVTGGCQITVHPGQWIAKTETGEFRVYHPEAFDWYYEEIGGDL